MSMKLEIIFDTVRDLVDQCRDIIQNFSDLSVVVVDNHDKKDNNESTEAVASAGCETPVETQSAAVVSDLSPPAPAEEPAAAASDPTPPTQPGLKDVLNMLTNAHRNGDADTKGLIVGTRDQLGLKYLSHAKDEHLPPLVTLATNLGLIGS